MIVSRSLITCGRGAYDQLWWLLGIVSLLVKFTYNNIYHSNIEMTSLRHYKGGCVGIQLVGLRLKL